MKFKSKREDRDMETSTGLSIVLKAEASVLPLQVNPGCKMGIIS